MTSPFPQPARPAWPIAHGVLACLVFLLVYGAELGGFTLSIDEEIASIDGASMATWLSQGRWGMALLVAVLPPVWAVPVVATVLFGAGLVVAAVRGTADLRLDAWQARAFIVLHIGFPVWLHLGEFSTLAPGIGAGVAAAACGAGLAVRARRPSELAWAVVLVAFATGVYQTLGLYALLYALMALHAQADEGDAASPGWRALARHAARTLVVLVCGFSLYVVVQRALSAAFDVPRQYIDTYWKLDALLAAPGEVAASGLAALRPFLDGQHPTYLGLGIAVLVLPWLGLVPTWLAVAPSGAPGARLARFLLVLGAGLAIVALPFLLSAGTLPIRAHVALPLLAAWLASRTRLPALRVAPAAWAVALAYVAVACATIGATLFHLDRLARDADAALATTLVPAIRNAAGDAGTAPVAFTLSGRVDYPDRGTLRRVGVFGTSFFGHDQGNVHRVRLYLQTLGVDGLQAVPLGSRPDLIPEAARMPAWPAPGAVKQVNGVVIVKLGPATPPQLAAP